MEAKKQIWGVGENMGTEESKKIWEENAQFWDPPEFHQRTHRVRLRNLGTTDKKSSHEIKHRKIPRVH